MAGKVLRLTDYLREEFIFLGVKAKDKKQFFRRVMDLLKARNAVRHPQKIVKVLLRREKLGPTSLGGGVALPHARTTELEKTLVAVAYPERPIEFAPGEEPVKVAIFILNSANMSSSYIQILARLARLLRNPANRKALFEASTASDVLKVFENFDREAEEIERKLRG